MRIFHQVNKIISIHKSHCFNQCAVNYRFQVFFSWILKVFSRPFCTIQYVFNCKIEWNTSPAQTKNTKFNTRLLSIFQLFQKKNCTAFSQGIERDSPFYFDRTKKTKSELNINDSDVYVAFNQCICICQISIFHITEYQKYYMSH